MLGVLSDSHGRAATTAVAAAALIDAGADLLIHLGDIGSLDVLDALAGVPARIVFGNCDVDLDGLREGARERGIAVDHPAGRLVVGGREVAYTHGHLGACVQVFLAERVDYLLLGHTHVVRDEHVGGTRMINPGALFRAPRYTAVLLDPELDQVSVLDVCCALTPVFPSGVTSA